METKSSLISTINGYITSVVTVLKVRNAFSSIINELFQTTTTYSLETGTNVFRYKLRFKKIGNIVFLDGYITNKYTTPQSALNIYSIPNSLYYGKTSEDTVCVIPTTNGTYANISISGDVIYLISALGINETLRFNIHYQTND